MGILDAPSYSRRQAEKRGFKPAVSMKVLNVDGDGRYYWNSTQTIQDNVSTFTDPVTGKVYRAAVYTASNQKAYVYLWGVDPETQPQSVCISNLAGAPLGTYTEMDLHNNYSLAWDSTGRLHVAGNMHGAPFRYIKATNPLDIAAWTSPGMGDALLAGVAADQVAYPRFLNLPGGDLVFSWRKGASGSGDTYWKRLNISTGVWSAGVKVLNGVGASPAASGYYGRQFIEDDSTAAGVIHTFFIWANPYTEMCYARSRDGGTTWEDVQGNALSLPIVPIGTTGTKATIYTTGSAAGQQGMVNACPAWVDGSGRPHTANLKTVTENGVANRQLMHLWWNGTAWVNEVLTSHRESGAPLGGGNPAAPTGQITSPIIFGAPDGKVFVAYTHRLDNERGSIWCIDVDEPYRKFALAHLDSFSSDLTYDQRALHERDELTFLWTPSVLEPGTGGGGAYSTIQSGGYLSVPGVTNWIGRWLGAWNAATAYVINDLVLDGGLTYRRIADGTTATAPGSDATSWVAVTFAVGDNVNAVGPLEPTAQVPSQTGNRTWRRLTTGGASAANITTDTVNWAISAVDDWWSSQPVAVITVDLNQISKVQAGAARLPHIKRIAVIGPPADASVSSGAWIFPANVPAYLTPPELRGKSSQFIGTWNAATAYVVGDVVTSGVYGEQYLRRIAGTTATAPELDFVNWEKNIGKGAAVMCRLLVRGLSGKAGRMLLLRAYERESGSSNARSFATVAFPDQAASIARQTPWVPCKHGPFSGKDGEIRLEGRQLGTGGTANTVACALEIGVLAGPGTGVE